MKEIPLTKGKVTLVDDEDYEWLSQWKWHYNIRGYARRTKMPERKELAMHRVIMQPPENMVIDHINGNKLDNQRKNLRVITQKENSRWAKRHYNTTKKYKGVFFDRRCSQRPYFAQINVDGRKKNKGNFKTEEEAALAYNEMAKKYFGEYAKLNEIVVK